MILQTTSFASNCFFLFPPASLRLYIASTFHYYYCFDCCCCYYDMLCYALLLPCTSQSITIETLQRNHQKYFAKYNRFGVLITSEFRLFLFSFAFHPSLASFLSIPLISPLTPFTHFYFIFSFLFTWKMHFNLYFIWKWSFSIMIRLKHKIILMLLEKP